LRLFEPSVGQLHARLVGEWNDDNKLSAKLEQFMGNCSADMALPQSGSIEGFFDPDENALRGRWKTDAGTEGDLWWVCVANQSPTEALAPAPQLVPREEYLQPPSAETGRFLAKSSPALPEKRKSRWLAIAFGVALAALAGYFLMSFLLDVLLDG